MAAKLYGMLVMLILATATTRVASIACGNRTIANQAQLHAAITCSEFDVLTIKWTSMITDNIVFPLLEKCTQLFCTFTNGAMAFTLQFPKLTKVDGLLVLAAENGGALRNGVMFNALAVVGGDIRINVATSNSMIGRVLLPALVKARHHFMFRITT